MAVARRLSGRFGPQLERLVCQSCAYRWEFGPNPGQAHGRRMGVHCCSVKARLVVALQVPGQRRRSFLISVIRRCVVLLTAVALAAGIVKYSASHQRQALASS